MEDNIVAISTSLGVGAISIIRCSGESVIEVVNRHFTGVNLNEVATHTIHYGHIIDKDEIIDEVLVSVMRSPKTYTMEDIVEINCHGGITTTNKVLEILLSDGCRQAEPGEFIKRAFLNGRIDLIEAEAVNDLINSQNDEARKYALNRMEGNLSKRIKNSRNILIDLETHLEVNFDYPEEVDNIEMTHEIVLDKLNIIKSDLEDLLNHSKDGHIINNGIDVAILGRPNVGKSSILNTFLDKEKAIVTDIAGTTRDIVEGNINISGIKINLIDTAGIRNTDDVIEKIGVDKSIKISKSADLIIYVLSNDTPVTTEDIEIINKIKDKKVIIFINKTDKEKIIDEKLIPNKTIIYGNTVELDGINNLKNKIIEMFNLQEIKQKDYNYLSNSRQISLIRKANESIDNAIKNINNFYPLEMIAVDIKEAFDYLGEILGITYKDEIIDELFSKFCLGK